jgi:hypothetical protein
VPGGDLLLISGDARYRFFIGPSFSRGEVGAWTRLRWFLAQHPLLLVPFLLTGVLGLALVLRSSLDARVRERLRLATLEAP